MIDKEHYLMTDSGTHIEAPSYQIQESIGKRFGHKLKELRTSRGMTQMQLSIASGLDRSFISDIERGVKEPTISTLDLLRSVFRISLSDFFKGV